MNQQHKKRNARRGGNRGGQNQTAQGAIHSRFPTYCLPPLYTEIVKNQEPGTPQADLLPQAHHTGELPQAHTGALCAPLLAERQTLLQDFYQASTAGLLWESRRIAARYRLVISALHRLGGLAECQPN